MRIICGFLFCLVGVMFVTCEKNKVGHSSSDIISWKDCSQKYFGSDKVRICFDSLVEDSRCPIGALCFWQGIAVVRFSFYVNNDDRELTMAPLNSPPLYPSDTSVLGYKIEFVSLQPYSKIGEIRKLSEYKVEIKITKQ